MTSITQRAIRGPELRRAIRWSYVAAVVWAAGNALLSTQLIIFLAQEYGAQGREVSFLLAAPALVGLLRLFTPRLIADYGGVKRLCLGTSIASYVMLGAIPLLALRGMPSGNVRATLPALIAVYCTSQLLEQIGTVVLWTWLGDLVPRRILGRYFGRRTLLQLCAVVPMLLLSVAATEYLQTHFQGESRSLPYALLTGTGTTLMLLAMWPLSRMPDVTHHSTDRLPIGTQLAAPLHHRPSRRLLGYGCWFAFFNGLTATPQNIYPKGVLKLNVRDLQGMQTVMRLGQAGLSFFVGPWSDRRGNRTILFLSQIAVGLAPLFFLWSTPEHPYRLYGAYVLWSAYVGINICLPNLTMLLAPKGGRASHLAAYYAYTSLFLTVGTLVGGELFDYVRRPEFKSFWTAAPLDPFQMAFVIALITRTAGALLLLRVDEQKVP